MFPSYYELYCAKLKEENIYRLLPYDREINRNFLNASVIDFSTNDYLNLSTDKEALQSGYQAGLKYGVGSTGSRLLSGDSELYNQFESQISKDKNTEAALLFNSGYQANLGVLGALCDPKVLKEKPLVFFDRLNHASLYQGLFLNNIHPIRFRHNDMKHLTELLETHQSNPAPKFIVCETLYGMDGDFAPLNEIIALARIHNAFLYLDEAHATGLYGANGYGLSNTADLKDINYAIMGTFSKALGVCGAYISSSFAIKEYLVNRCASFIYSTALSPIAVGAAMWSWNKVRSMSAERTYLLKKADDVRKQLQAKGYDIGTSSSHIITVMVGVPAKALALQEQFARNNIKVAAIRPPTVPPGTSRIKISLTLNHSDNDINKLINLF